MEVVLTKDVPSLGHKGEVKKVKNGYFLNFLAPRGKAIRLTPKIRVELDRNQAMRQKRRAEIIEKASEIAEKIEKMTVTFKRKATAKGKLYGSITEEMLQRELEKYLKCDLHKGCVYLNEAIKTTGEHTARVQLTETVSVNLNVVVQSE